MLIPQLSRSTRFAPGVARGTHLFRLALCALLISVGAARTSAHEPGLHDAGFHGCPDDQRRNAPGGQLDEDDRVYYLDFFAELVLHCALEPWPQFSSAVADLVANQLPLGQAQNLYAQATGLLPVIQVSWDGQQAVLLSAPPFQVAAGVQRTVLVEVTNLDSLDGEMRAEAEGAGESNVAVTAPGAERGLVVRLVLDDARATSFQLTVRSRLENDTITVPVDVVNPATIVGTVEDADLVQPLAGRVYVQGADAEFRHGPAYADVPTLSLRRIAGAGARRYKLPFFYSDGSFQIQVPPGQVDLTLERGFEFSPVSLSVNLAEGEVRPITLSSGRLVDMRRMNWVSGETHVHWVRDNLFNNEDLDLLGVVQRAEDVQVVNNLTLRHYNAGQGVEWTRPDQEPMGPVPGHSTGPYLIQMGEEFRNDPFYGHLCFLNLTSLHAESPQLRVPGQIPYSGLVPPVSTGDILGTAAEDYPLNYSRIELARLQKPRESRPIITAAHGLKGEVPADVALGHIDSLDQIRPEDYYRFLDCGFRLPITEGGDFPANLIGRSRCYVKTERPFTYGRWIDGILRGTTFVTSGPLLWMTVNGADIGEKLAVSGGDPLNVQVEARSRFPIGRLQIISNNEILHDAVYNGTAASIDFDFSTFRSRWIVARCSAAPQPSYRVLQEVNAAHTSATYILVNGDESVFVDSGAAHYLRNLCEAGGDDVYENGTFHAPGAQLKREEARDYFYAGRDVYQAIMDANL